MRTFFESINGRLGRFLGVNWMISYTKPNRYESNGVIYHVMEYASATRKNSMVIIDVGCSTGAAAKAMKAKLAESGVESFVIGVDINPKVHDEARKNLNEFIEGDARNLSQRELPLADVVICSYAAIWVTAEVRYAIVRRCAEQLKEDGTLITNAFPFSGVNLPRPAERLWYRLASLPYLMQGLGPFGAEVTRRRIELLKRYSYAIEGRSDALEYAEGILKTWNDLPTFSRLTWNLQIFLKAPDSHLKRFFKSL